jgi:hypothetical protein
MMAATSPKKLSAPRARRPRATAVGGALVQPATKTTDNKGRVVLGAQFANKHVILERVSDTEVRVKLARVIPEDEAWLYENPRALDAVRKGLAQARRGEFVKGPNVDSDAALAAQMEG